MNIPIDITFASGSNVIMDPFDPDDNDALAAIEAAGATAAAGRATYDIKLPTSRFWIAGLSLEVSAAATLIELGTTLANGTTWVAAVTSHLFGNGGPGAGIVRQFAPSPGPKVPVAAAALFRIRASSAAGFRLTGVLDLYEEV